MNLRTTLTVVVPSIAITALIVLVVAIQTAPSASINQASDTNEKLNINQKPETVPLALDTSTEAADVQLTDQSSIEEIQRAMQGAHLHYDTLHVVMVTEEMNGDVSTDEVWLSQSLKSFRHVRTLNFSGENPDEFVTVSDGTFTSMFLPEADGNVVLPANTGESSVPAAQGAPSDAPVIVPNWFESMAPTVGLLIMPADFVRVEMAAPNVSILGEDVLLDRSTVMLRVLSAESGGYNLWVDASTGIILRAERIAFDGVITYSFTITQLEINPDIDSSMFYVDHTAYDPELLEQLWSQSGD